MKHPITTKR